LKNANSHHSGQNGQNQQQTAKFNDNPHPTGSNQQIYRINQSNQGINHNNNHSNNNNNINKPVNDIILPVTYAYATNSLQNPTQTHQLGQNDQHQQMPKNLSAAIEAAYHSSNAHAIPTALQLRDNNHFSHQNQQNQHQNNVPPHHQAHSKLKGGSYTNDEFTTFREFGQK
jgi:hypothetical protein